jgi:putative ABC transport system permease protein
MGSLLADLRYGARMLLKKPGYTLIAVMTLSLGIGACTAIFSIVDAVLLRSLPYPAGERVVQLREVDGDGVRMDFTDPNFRDVRESNRTLEAVAAYGGGMQTVTGGVEPLRVRMLAATNDFFRVLGVAPIAGRTFLPDDVKDGGQPVAVISYGFWQRAFSGRTGLDALKLRSGDLSFDVVGVMPPDFSYPREFDVWIPREIFPPETSRSAHNWNVIARIKEDVTLAQARADLSAIAGQIKHDYGKNASATDAADAVDIAAIPLQEFLVSDAKNVLLIVLAAVGFLLMVACANVVNLVLAQATARQKEFAVRAALGATRFKLAMQFVTENVLLALIAGMLGVVFALWGIDLLISLNPGSLPRADEIGVDARALGFTLGLTLIVAVMLGLAPLTQLSQKDLHDDLKEGGRGQVGHAMSNRLRGALVVAQMALTLILLTGAGLLGKSFYRLLQVDPGFRAESAIVADLSLSGYTGPDRVPQYMRAFDRMMEGLAPGPIVEPPEYEEFRKRQWLLYRQLLDGIKRLPGVVAVGGVNGVPMDGRRGDGIFLLDGNPQKRGYADYRVASAGYFAAMGISLLRGRDFDESDGPDAPHSAVISQSLARKYWPNEDPIGKRIQFGNMDVDLRLLHIVGVVGDVRGMGLEKDAEPTVYANALQRPPYSALSIVVRTQADPATLTTAVRRTVQSLNSELPVNFRTLQQIFSSSLDRPRFSLVIFAAFAAVALTLAVMGIYGVMAYAVAERRRELAIRISLGAENRDVFRLIIGGGMRLALAGVALGVAGAFALARMLSAMLYGVSPTDIMTFSAVALLLTLVALLACWIPARRATKVDPMVALRWE